MVGCWRYETSDEPSGLERASNEEQDEVDILVPGMGMGMGKEILGDKITLARRLEIRKLFCSSA